MRATIAEQLENLKLVTKKSNQPFFNLEFSSVLNLGKEGDDHINCWENSSTKLGRALSLVSGPPLNHSIFGPFRTMFGFWNFILLPSQDDELRTLNGKALHSLCTRLNRQHYSNNNKEDFKFIRNFRAIILDAYYQRVMGSSELKDLICKNELEIDCYYIRTDNGLRVRNKNFKWMIPLFAELSSAVKENREPCYELFMSDKEIDIYYDVLPQCVAETIDARAKAKFERSVKLKQAREAKRLRELEAAENVKTQTLNASELQNNVSDVLLSNTTLTSEQESKQTDVSKQELTESPNVTGVLISADTSNIDTYADEPLVTVLADSNIEDYQEDSLVKKKQSTKPLPVSFEDPEDESETTNSEYLVSEETQEDITDVVINEPTAGETAMSLALKNALKQ